MVNGLPDSPDSSSRLAPGRCLTFMKRFHQGGQRIVAMLSLVALAFTASAESLAQASPKPLTQAHSHNDYQQPRPLEDALAQGFCSVEADIFLVGEDLLVGHYKSDLKPGRTLQALYLEPLKKRVLANRGRVYAGGPTFHLLIDLKTESEPIYKRLKEVLKGYQDLLTRFDQDRTTLGAISITLSGDRPKQILLTENPRWAAYDGNLDDMGKGISVHQMPLVSANWAASFKWRGLGDFPEEERAKLAGFVAQAHKDKHRLRFWGAPDIEPAWRELQKAGVDLINTDHLPELARFLNASNPAAQ